jgi:hypothetical protein
MARRDSPDAILSRHSGSWKDLHQCRASGNGNQDGVAFLYCNFQRQKEQSTETLFSSILRQLVGAMRATPEHVQELHSRHKNGPTRPSLDELLDALEKTIACYPRTQIVVDALDECRVSDVLNREFLSKLLALQSKTGFNLLATSQFIPEIGKMFEERCAKLEIRANDVDIRLALDARMWELPSFISGNPSLRNDIMEKIIQLADGMYGSHYPFLLCFAVVVFKANFPSALFSLSSTWIASKVQRALKSSMTC